MAVLGALSLFGVGLNARGHAILHEIASEAPLDSLRLVVELCAFAVSPSHDSTVLSASASWAIGAASSAARKAMHVLGFTTRLDGRESCKVVAEARDRCASRRLVRERFSCKRPLLCCSVVP